MNKNRRDKNVVNDKELRIKAISNYVYYIEHLSEQALETEYKHSIRKCSTINAILYEPDEHRPDDLFD